MTRLRRIAFCAILLAAAATAGLGAATIQAQQTPSLDLNTATPAQLLALPGMGPAYVRRVIAGRPYSAKNQLLTRGVLPADEYQRIRDRIVAHRARKSLPNA